MYIPDSPVEIQTTIHWNLIVRSMTAAPPVLSPSSNLPPPSSHCAFIPARKILRRLSKRFFLIFNFFLNCIPYKYVSRRVAVCNIFTFINIYLCKYKLILSKLTKLMDCSLHTSHKRRHIHSTHWAAAPSLKVLRQLHTVERVPSIIVIDKSTDGLRM